MSNKQTNKQNKPNKSYNTKAIKTILHRGPCTPCRRLFSGGGDNSKFLYVWN